MVLVAGGIGLPPLRPVVHALLARPRALRPRQRALRRPLARRAALRRRARGVGRRGVIVDVARRRRLARARRRRHARSSRARRSTRRNTVAMMCGPEVMMRFAVAALRDRGVPADAIWVSLERSMKCGVGHCGHCQLGPLFLCKDGPVLRHDAVEPLLRVAGAVSARLAVWKFASCDGCQLSLLDCEDELLAARRRGRPRLLPRGGPRARRGRRTTSRSSRARSRRAHDAERIRDIRARSRRLIAIGACATAGGIQALRNFADVDEFAAAVYAEPAVHRDAARLDARQRARRRRLRAPAAARPTRASCSR